MPNDSNNSDSPNDSSIAGSELSESAEPSSDELQLVESYIRLAQGRRESSGDNKVLDTVVDRFEMELGVKKPVELTRWYLLSVIRYLQEESWNDPEQCGFDIEQQEELAVQYLSGFGAFKSLTGVLRKKHLRYTLVNFAEKTNNSLQILSTKTKAFALAERLLFDKIIAIRSSNHFVERESLSQQQGLDNSDIDSEERPNEEVWDVKDSDENFADFTFELSETASGLDTENKGLAAAELVDGMDGIEAADSSSSAGRIEVVETNLNFDSSLIVEEADTAIQGDRITSGEGRTSANSINTRRSARRSPTTLSPATPSPTTPQMTFPFNQDLFADGHRQANGQNSAAASNGMNRASALVQDMEEDEFVRLEKAMGESKKGSVSLNPRQEYRQSMYAGVAVAWAIFLLYFLITS